MRLTFATEDGLTAEIDLAPASDASTNSAIVSASLGLDGSLVFIANGKQFTDITVASLTAGGVKDGDVVLVTPPLPPRGASSAAPARRGGRGRGGRGGLGHLMAAARGPTIDPAIYPSLTWDDLPGGVTPEQLYAILKVNTGMLSYIQRRDPAMYRAATDAAGPAALRSIFMTRQLEAALPEAERRAKRATLEARLAANPFDVEAQRELEEEIARENIAANRELALEHAPESFARVVMLYIDASVNGHEVKAFVDSGAQSTIMSKSCAERCGIMRLVDTQFAGTAVGVGSAKIIGRVHLAPLRIGQHFFNCTFTVLEQEGMDFLLGLDFLKRWQCCIDLFSHQLRLRADGAEVSVPFLGEADIPKGSFGRAGSSASSASEEDGVMSGAGARASAAAGGAGGPAPAHVDASAGAARATASAVAPPALPSAAPVAPPPVPSLTSASRAGSSGTSGSGIGSTAPAAAANPFSAVIDLTGLAPAAPPAPAAATRPATASARPAAASSGTGSGGGGSAAAVNEASVATLMGMGYSREQVVRALHMAHGNLELAASILPDLM